MKWLSIQAFWAVIESHAESVNFLCLCRCPVKSYFKLLMFTFLDPPDVAGRVVWNRICLSFCPSILLSRCFLGIVSSVFYKFWHEPDFPEFFFPKNWENGPKMDQKQVFLNLLKSFINNFYWICSIMKIYIICCVLVQVSYLGKFWFRRYGPKCSQPVRLQDFLINNISRTNQWNNLIFCMLIQIHIY